MKKIYLFLFLCSTFLGLNAQMLNFGIKGGVSFTNYRDGEVGNRDFSMSTNYHAGALAELKVLSNLYLQGELLFSKQGAEFEQNDFTVKNELIYVSVPVLAKVYINDNNLSLEVGPQFSFLASERNEVGSDTEDYDLGVIGGIGLKFTDAIFVQARYVLGLSDLKRDSDIKNTAIQISLGFMF
jgi:hypothetical protein|uniref:porin family protein n=2 Tax=Flavobacterium sp. TaxID=239 RepID=UPI00404B841E